MIVKQKEAQET